MPKRLLRQHLDSVAKTRRKSMLIDDPSQLSTNLKEDENNKEEIARSGAEHIRYLKSNKNNEIERLLLNNSKYLVYRVDHCDFPAFNVGLWPQESHDDFVSYPSYAFSVPRPVYVSNNECEQIDICYKRPMARESHRRRIRHARTAYQTAWKGNKTIRSAAKDGIFHTSVYDIAERLYLQPDPFFNSSYDYYFTGGNLCTLSNNVIHAGGEQLQQMMVSAFPVVEDCIDRSTLVNLGSNTTSENCEIFEISPLITSPNCNRQNCFIARQRNLISLNVLNSNNQIKTITQFRNKNTPFISFAQSQRNINTLILTTMKQHVRLYDLNCSGPALVKLFEISPQISDISWNTIKPWREHTFLYANEKQFFLIDTRTSSEQWLERVTVAGENSTCDHISALLPSDFNNLFYVATNHNLNCMDIRHLKNVSFTDSGGAICRWSHQLRYAPLMMDTFRLRQIESVALSSPISGDLHICQLSRERNAEYISIETPLSVNKHIYGSPCLAYQPPTLLEAYESARLSGKCLDPEANLEARIKCCTTGMAFLKPSLNSEQSEAAFLLTSNSNGDIFAHTLSKREKKETEVRCNKESDILMDEFAKRICKESQPTLNYTHIKNLKSLRKVFLCETLSSANKNFDAMDNELEGKMSANNTENPTNISEKRRTKRLHFGRWQKPLSVLHSYKDALVPDILSIWDIDIEEERHIHLGNLQQNVIKNSDARVKDWLDSYINPNPPTVTIPDIQDLSKYNDNNVSDIFDSSLNINRTQNTTIDFENAVHSTQIMMDRSADISNNLDESSFEVQIHNDTTTILVEKFKNKKKNKKYVKGF